MADTYRDYNACSGNVPKPVEAMVMARRRRWRASSTSSPTRPWRTLGGVQNGDVITLDVPARRINLQVADAEPARRRTVPQADEGCDVNVLVPGRSTS